MKNPELIFSGKSFEVWKQDSFFTKYCVFVKGKKGKQLINTSMTKKGALRILDNFCSIAEMLTQSKHKGKK